MVIDKCANNGKYQTKDNDDFHLAPPTREATVKLCRADVVTANCMANCYSVTDHGLACDATATVKLSINGVVKSIVVNGQAHT